MNLPPSQDGRPERVSYFVVRVGRGGAGEALHGVVERLGGGEKLSFASGAELLAAIAAWLAAEPGAVPPQS